MRDQPSQCRQRAQTSPPFIRLIAALLLAPGLAATLAACDYPEAGFYELRLYGPEVEEDGTANSKALFKLPFRIEEITDDTDLTIGFVAQLPGDKALITCPLENSSDTSRRGWVFEVSDSDSQAGDLSLFLEHYGERLALNGRYRQASKAPVQVLHSVMPSSGVAVLDPPLIVNINGVAMLAERVELARSTQAELEKRIGTTLKDALRIPARDLDPLPEPEQQQNPAASERNEKKGSPRRPLGGRSGSGR